MNFDKITGDGARHDVSAFIFRLGVLDEYKILFTDPEEGTSRHRQGQPFRRWLHQLDSGEHLRFQYVIGVDQLAAHFRRSRSWIDDIADMRHGSVKRFIGECRDLYRDHQTFAN